MTAFAGRVGLVTGSASGIGRATALLLAQRGARVVAADIDGKRVTETVEAIRESGGEGAACPGDVTRAEDVEAAIALARRRFGRLDVDVNCAGI